MMNAKELRQTAAYIVEQRDNHDKFRMVEGDEAFMNADGEPDAVTFARHILATVREDDDEPVTRDFLNSHSTASFGEALYSRYEFTDNLSVGFVAEEYESNRAAWMFGAIKIPVDIKTRGQFRALCKGLGLELKEEA